jgi:diguanylate cyclase (GGDEF)-like protein
MTLDVQTLIVLMLANVFMTSVALLVVIGWRASPGARWAQASSLAQALGWGSFLLARPVHDRLFSSLCMGFLGLSFVAMWHSMHHWLGPRPGRRPLLWACALTPLGYFALFDSYEWRVGWSNFGLALQMALVCWAVAAPAPHASRRWRGLFIGCLACLATLTLARGVLGAFFTELYPHYRAPHPVNIAAAVVHHLSLVLITVASLVAWHEEAEQALVRLAETDLLTGLPNRRGFEQQAGAALARARRHADPTVLLMIDIDRFKAINDRHGHAGGDEALRRFARALRQTLRRGDLCARYGGEEFCVLLHRADGAAASRFDTRLRQALHALAPSREEAIAFSAGVAVYGADGDGVDALLRQADKALYRAKENGRGRMEWSAAAALAA